jgi:phospholipid/cholesterol/gamma-HCH transport system substrate-binding protein
VKRFRERNRVLVGLIGLVVTAVLIVGALEFEKLPLIHSNANYAADFASAGGLSSGDIVTIHGVKVGSITGMSLDGPMVKVTFNIQSGIRLGTTTSANAEVLSPVGTEYMQLVPSGPGSIGGTIPLSRTTVPYNLVTDLSGLGSEIQQYNIPELEKSMEVASQDLDATPESETVQAFDDLARFSKVIGGEQSALATIVSQGAKLTGVLSDRSHQLFDLFGQANLVLQVIEQRKAAVQQLFVATSNLSKEISSILTVNRSQFSALLSNLQTVSAVLAKESSDFGQAIPVLAAFSRYAANTTGSGPFADVSAPTLLIPDNLVEQCSARGAYPSHDAQVGCRP